MWVRLTWPLTGRSEEIRIIETTVLDPSLSGIVVCGAAGVGKSRIAREALSSAALNRCEVRWAVGTSSARELPLGALAPWAGSAGTNTLHAVRGVIESLTAGRQGATVVLGVDDVHMLDDLSAFVLHQIVQRGAAKLVLTVRDEELVPAGVRDVWKDGKFERLDLQPLSRDDSAALLSATLRGSVDPAAARRLWELTRGNVLFLRNIVERDVTDGRLAQEHGFWRWIAEPVVPPSLVELIESRIGALPTSVSDVVDALAVGEPIDLASMNQITDPAAVEEADLRGLITLEPVQDGVEVRVAHPLYGEVRRKRAAPTRLRRLRALVAGALAESDHANDMRVVVRRAALSLDSDLTPDPELLVRAAQGAVWMADMPLADRLADAAIRADGAAEAYFIRGHALSWLSRGEEADAVLADIQTSELSDADQARLVVLRASNRLWALADPAGAKNFIDDMARAAPPQGRVAIDAFLTVYWFAMGNSELATRLSKNLALHDFPVVIGTEIAWTLTATAADAGRTTEAEAVAEAGYLVAARSFDAPHMRFIIGDAHVGALLQSGRIGGARHVAERLREEATDLPGAAQLLGTAVAGRAALGEGRLRLAFSLLGPVTDALSAAGESNGWAYRYQLSRTIALGMCGSTDEAVAALATLEKLRHPSWRFLDYERGVAHAWVAACQGAVTEASRKLVSAAETARVNGQFAAEVLCLQTVAQFGDGSSAPRLHELEVIVEGPRVGLAARFATALHAGDAAELATLSDEFEQMGDRVAAVDAAAHATLAYRAQGLRGSAFGCAVRAQELAEQCGGALTPALRQVTEPLPLTEREREIVMLLGEGLTSREIAERLVVSVRTAESHIYKAMAKTGTSSRDELAALLPRRNPRRHE